MDGMDGYGKGESKNNTGQYGLKQDTRIIFRKSISNVPFVALLPCMDVSEVDDCLSAFASEGVAAVSDEEVDALPVLDTLAEPVLDGSLTFGGMDIPEPFAGLPLPFSVADLVLSFTDLASGGVGTFSALASPACFSEGAVS